MCELGHIAKERTILPCGFSPRFLAIFPAMVKLAVVGATGGLGQCIVKQAAASGHTVTAVVRDAAKAAEAFAAFEVSIKVADLASGAGLSEAFAGQDAVVEVISNSERPHAVEKIIAAAESAGVSTFAACGGGGVLRVAPAPDSPLLYIVLGDSMGAWLKPVTELHLAVQKLAFESKIPTVFQLAPPQMVPGELSRSFVPQKDVVAGVNKVSYEDYADVFLQALLAAGEYNRSSVAIAPKTA